jgi:ribosomal-protein-alanine N-acetyltransferase
VVPVASTRSGSFQIRPFRPDDLDAVVNIKLTTLPENYSSSFYLNHYYSYPKSFLVADVDGLRVGYAMCRVEYGMSNLKFGFCHKGHVISVAVLPEHRRKGLGIALMDEAMVAMRGYGSSEYYLEVRVSNLAAVGMYQKMGYHVAKRLRNYYMDGEDAFLMAKAA